MEFGEPVEKKEGLIYIQDLYRLKAILFNNISMCYYRWGKIDQADKFNDMAIMEDPDYARATYQKCKILESR